MIIECGSEKTLTKVQSNIRAEVLVFYSSKTTNNKPLGGSDLLKASSQGYFEENFLLLIETTEIDYFTFYSDPHLSIEIFGRKNGIISCFNEVVG